MAPAAGVVIEWGEGAYLYGEGMRLLDAVSGYGVAPLGHSHLHRVEAVTSQGTGWPSPPCIRMSRAPT
jgi:acetylornithine/succinyldiaminopimelate/putrescine aminotransferase